MNNKTNSAAIWLFDFLINAAVAVLAVVGCVLSWQNNGIGMLQFYTVDSNLLGAAACGISAYCIIRRKINGKTVPDWVRILKFVAVCCLMVTFLVVLLVLAPMVSGSEGYHIMFTERDMLYHHLLCPMLILFSFLLFARLPVMPLKAAAYAVIPTCLYAVITVTLNLFGLMDGPYPFLHVYEQPFLISCLWFVAILGDAFTVGLLLATIKKQLRGE